MLNCIGCATGYLQRITAFIRSHAKLGEDTVCKVGFLLTSLCPGF